MTMRLIIYTIQKIQIKYLYFLSYNYSLQNAYELTPDNWKTQSYSLHVVHKEKYLTYKLYIYNT